MKKALLYILILSFAVRPAFYVGQFVYYAANIDYIIETYCINKDKPEMKCDGKCYLSKQLTSVSQEQSGLENDSFILNAFFPVFTPPTHTVDHYCNLKVVVFSLSYYSNPIYSNPFWDHLLRPPIV